MVEHTTKLKIKAFTLIGIEFYSQYLKQYLKKTLFQPEPVFALVYCGIQE